MIFIIYVIFEFVLRFSNVVKSLELNEELSVRVVSSRIDSLAIHPSETSLLIAVGSQKGHLSKIDLKTTKYFFGFLNFILI